MSTQKPRINMVLESENYRALKTLAEREGKSLSDLARTLILEMLEILEDQELAAVASERRKSFSRNKALTHEAVWGSHGLRHHVSPRRR